MAAATVPCELPAAAFYLLLRGSLRGEVWCSLLALPACRFFRAVILEPPMGTHHRLTQATPAPHPTHSQLPLLQASSGAPLLLMRHLRGGARPSREI